MQLLIGHGQVPTIMPEASKIKVFWGLGENFHLEVTFFSFGGGKLGKISVGDGENHCLRMMIFLLM